MRYDIGHSLRHGEISVLGYDDYAKHGADLVVVLEVKWRVLYDITLRFGLHNRCGLNLLPSRLLCSQI
jgi:hypothetical protein